MSAAEGEQERLMLYTTFTRKYSRYHKIPYHHAMVAARSAYNNYKGDFIQRQQESKVAQPIIPGKKKVGAPQPKQSKKQAKKQVKQDGDEEMPPATEPQQQQPEKVPAPAKQSRKRKKKEEELPEQPPVAKKVKVKEEAPEPESVDPALKTFFDSAPPPAVAAH